MPAIVFFLDRHRELEAELEQKLEENVLLGAIGFHVLDGIEKRFREILAVRVPGADVGGVEFEDAEAEIGAMWSDGERKNHFSTMEGGEERKKTNPALPYTLLPVASVVKFRPESSSRVEDALSWPGNRRKFLTSCRLWEWYYEHKTSCITIADVYLEGRLCCSRSKEVNYQSHHCQCILR